MPPAQCALPDEAPDAPAPEVVAHRAMTDQHRDATTAHQLRQCHHRSLRLRGSVGDRVIDQTFYIAVGGAASGTLSALRLMRVGGEHLRIALIERGPSFGSGIAYAMDCEEHLLNSRAGDMSA